MCFVNLDEVNGDEAEEVLPVRCWWAWGFVYNCAVTISCLLQFPGKDGWQLFAFSHTQPSSHLMHNDGCHALEYEVADVVSDLDLIL